MRIKPKTRNKINFHKGWEDYILRKFKEGQVPLIDLNTNADIIKNFHKYFTKLIDLKQYILENHYLFVHEIYLGP